MKKLLLVSIVFGLSLLCFPVHSQNTGQLGLPGDNLNLYGVLSLFQQSQTLEEFEQKLNAEDSRINNLDLDGDGKIDYIKVIDNVNGNAHIIILRDILNTNESQDVAVIEVAKDANNRIQIQIIGDMALYGKDYIVEPASGTPNPGYSSNSTTTVVAGGGHNVYEYNNYYTNSNVGYGDAFMYTIGAWSIIHYIFAPNYVVYNSPYRYGYYPTYWHSWQPVYYNEYYNHWNNHRGYEYFHQTHEYRVPAARTYYEPRRSTSVAVHNRIETGEYKRTYNRNADNRTNRSSVRGNDNRVNGRNNAGGNRNAVINSGNRQPTNNQNINKPNNTNRPVINNNNNARPTPRTDTRQNVNTNSAPNARPAQNTNNVNKGNNSNRPVNNNNRTAPRNEVKAKPSQNARPAEKKVEHKESERK